MTVQVEGGCYESSVSQEKQDVLNSSSLQESDRPISLKTDKAGRLRLETVDDLQNLLLLRKRKRERKRRSPVCRAAAAPAPTVPYYVDEEDFFKACDQSQLVVIDRYLSIGGDPNACDS
ncbi:ankyrin repeat domain-containing protein 1-like, partial [Centroberyx gerrardi]